MACFLWNLIFQLYILWSAPWCTISLLPLMWMSDFRVTTKPLKDAVCSPNLLLRWEGDRCVRFCHISHQPRVEDHQWQRSWQATGLARDAIKTSTGYLRLTHTDSTEAASPHIRACCSNWDVKSSPPVTSDDFAINLFVCLPLGGVAKCLAAGNHPLTVARQLPNANECQC